METPKSLTLFSNGNIMAFDNAGQQMGELQKEGWMEIYFKHLESMGINPLDIKDIATIVNGRQVYVQPIKRDDGSWQMNFVDF